MKILFKISFLTFVLIQLLLSSSISIAELIFLLLFLASSIFRVKYFNSIWLVAMEAILIYIAIGYNTTFVFLFGIIAFDLIEMGFYIGIVPILLIGYLNLTLDSMINFLFLIFLSCFFSYISHGLWEKEKILKQSFDMERKARYELDQTRIKLLESSKDIAHLTEIKERNRIAREIHDSIGHNIAGILLQLQATEKLFNKNNEKALDLLKKSVGGLAETLVHLRETVHNIKPKDNIGIEYIESIINHFQYCPVDIRFSGDFNKLPSSHMEIIASNIKESLTNITKHSKATKVNITIETNDMYTRLLIKDNGVGCSKIKENMGLGGMRDRIKNVGGSISINGQDGFMIVCVIPVEMGGEIFEGVNC
ncbi:sensor histidine kinase [Alkaliphilus peptidifermentans]|uniref:histidine kinase n=1 Tax=Alkaliphilus peptidifermentans DSM 18978 TaxID=1120976 RepID=A0A1G5L017_9FIRM|nr:sensor histidine kinase [Alkaliphilus peptidifermentans]SCZ05771.1 Signal transduction histidine kinase [Alkaliphilus peptidifermentans DSM 18978]